MKNSFIVSVGSNYYASRYIPMALKRLRASFEEIISSTPKVNSAIDSPKGCPDFVNCVAEITSQLTEEEVRLIIKEIEQTCGRRRYPKTKTKVAIDIDLLYWNDELRKPQDIHRPYVLEGMHELGRDL
ncbi:2-amino-4-hydroxy-6-hydroxymethyldihydropteridine diphosphokinase [Falsiporphyromonas endometrii]|uniref:2-amino-4-hydroxy-6-hydroxymethyldihydropteridine pyrophosphokinase n=1 Tax=Falsiporphyromonas endometrii TaxID=1387297 RepID=A0ABV9K642_9PORP